MRRWLSRVGTCLKLTGSYLRVMPQFIYGAWHVTRLPRPIVSIFGGSRFQEQTFYFNLAEQAGRELVRNRISVITGGGPGIMQAANCGALSQAHNEIRTLGITVEGLGEGQSNGCTQEYITVDYFSVRKHLLIDYSLGFIVFPGGYGTMDELAQLLTLMQTNQIPQGPVILIGVEYWASFFDWINVAERMGLVLKEHIDYITITDDISYATSQLIAFCQECFEDL